MSSWLFYLNSYNYFTIQSACLHLHDILADPHLFLSHIVCVTTLPSVVTMKRPLCVRVKEAAGAAVTSIKLEKCEDALELYGSHGLSAY